MEISVNFYPNDLPQAGEVVLVQMGEPKDDVINCKIYEYPNLNAIIQTSELTHKKRVTSIRSFISQKPILLEVLDNDNNIITLSKKYLKPNDIDRETRKLNDRIKLLSLLKSLSFQLKEDLDNLVLKILHPLLKILPPDNYFEYLDENYSEIDYDIFGEFSENVKDFFEEFYKSRPKKVKTIFSLISPSGISKTIELFEKLDKIHPELSSKIKLLATPQFILETVGLEEDEKNIHQKFLTNLTKNCQELGISMKLN
jgi:translation initiation factor 2 alpha subunit (eIF-2alpha)